MFDRVYESREERFAREAKEVKESKEIAEQQMKISQALFDFGDIRLDILRGFRLASIVYIYDETEDDAYFGIIKPFEEPIYDDMAASSFKAGDRFVCRVKEITKEKKKEVWLQYKYNKSFTNLYDLDRYFRIDHDDATMFIFVKPDGLAMIMTCPQELEFPKAKTLMQKTAKSIIKYDDNGYTVIKKKKS
jgi:hypothetical protein